MSDFNNLYGHGEPVEPLALILLFSIGMQIFLILILVLILPIKVSAREPSMAEVHDEVIRSIGFNKEEMESWRKQSKWAAALPRLDVGMDRDLTDQLSLSAKDSVTVTGGNVFVGPAQNNFDQNFHQGFRVGVHAIWQLDRLAFTRDALYISRERRSLVHERTRALEEVGKAYSIRRRLLQELKRPLPFILKDRKKLMLDQMVAKLDAYTDGWFTMELAK